MVARNHLGNGLVGLTVTFLVILAVSSFLRPYRREGFSSSSQPCPPGMCVAGKCIMNGEKC